MRRVFRASRWKEKKKRKFFFAIEHLSGVGERRAMLHNTFHGFGQRRASLGSVFKYITENKIRGFEAARKASFLDFEKFYDLSRLRFMAVAKNTFAHENVLKSYEEFPTFKLDFPVSSFLTSQRQLLKLRSSGDDEK